MRTTVSAYVRASSIPLAIEASFTTGDKSSQRIANILMPRVFAASKMYSNPLSTP